MSLRDNEKGSSPDINCPGRTTRFLHIPYSEHRQALLRLSQNIVIFITMTWSALDITLFSVRSCLEIFANKSR
jgi:hypothetical protein